MSKKTSGALSFDWVSFTVKPDKKARDTHYINLTEVLHLLSISDDKFKSFIDLGHRQYYDHCFKLDNIRIYATDTGMLLHPDSKLGEEGFKDYMSQGFNVEFSGQGCREYENIRLESDGAGLDSFSCWFSLFYALRCAVDNGCSVNFTRLDIALDCYDGTITVDKVREALSLGEVVTSFRTYTDSESEPITSVKRLSLKGDVLGNSITVGNRKSNTHVCIYDKLSEQRNKYKNDSVSLYKLRKLDSWTRFEMRIRNSVANAFMSGLLDSWLNRKRQDYSEVSEYIGSFINSKIRFVHLDNNRKCRCSLKNWWASFIGSCMRLKLAAIKPVFNVCRRAVNYVKHSLAPTLFSLAVRFSRDGLGVLSSAEENPQMMCYALGALELFDDIYDISNVCMTIYQPRRDNLSTFGLSKEDLFRWADDVLKLAADLAFAGDGNFLCGEWCGFCKAKNACRARAAANLELAKYEFKLSPLLTDEDVEGILSKVGDLVTWASDIKEYALQQAISGKEWSGWKLVEGRSNRKYVNDDAVAAAVTKVSFDPYEQKLLGLTAMQKLLGKARFEEVIAGLIEKPQGNPTLVPESDKRSAMNNAKSDFSEN